MSPNRLAWLLPLIAAALFAASPVRSPEVGRPDPMRSGAHAVYEGADEDRLGDEIGWYARRYRISPRLARTIWLAAREHEINPGIVFGLVATESRFDPGAVGRHGERGLLQIKLETARAHERRITPEALLRPETNLHLGLLHLKREVEHFGHDWTLGLLAYHMGRGRVTRALDRGRVPDTRYATRILAHTGEFPL